MCEAFLTFSNVVTRVSKTALQSIGLADSYGYTVTTNAAPQNIKLLCATRIKIASMPVETHYAVWNSPDMHILDQLRLVVSGAHDQLMAAVGIIYDLNFRPRAWRKPHLMTVRKR